MNTNKKLNMTMLCDFYELTMGNGYFKAGTKIGSPTLTSSSAASLTMGAMPSLPGWSRSLSTSRTSTLTPRTSPTSGAGRSLTRTSWTTWQTLSSPGTSLPSPRGPRCSPTSPFSPCGPGHPGPAAGDLPAADHQHQSLIATKPTGSSGLPGGGSAGVRLPPGPGVQRRHRRGPGRLHRRVQGDGLHHLRPALRRARRGHHGPRLGADL